MKMDYRNDSQITSEVKSPVKLPDPLPGLVGMKGGEKQHFLTVNRQLVLDMYEKYGFDYAKALFYMKDSTLTRFLKKAESKLPRKNITTADQAFNSAYLANERFYKLVPEIEAIEDALIQHSNNDHELRETLSNFFMIQEKLNGMMAKMVQNQDYIMSNFTEHILRNNSIEVGPTTADLSLSDVHKLKAGPTFHHDVEKYDRPSVSREVRTSAGNAGDDVTKAYPGNRSDFDKRKAGKVRTSRPRYTRGSLRERYQNAKRRHRRV